MMYRIAVESTGKYNAINVQSIRLKCSHKTKMTGISPVLFWAEHRIPCWLIKSQD